MSIRTATANFRHARHLCHQGNVAAITALFLIKSRQNRRLPVLWVDGLSIIYQKTIFNSLFFVAYKHKKLNTLRKKQHNLSIKTNWVPRSYKFPSNKVRSWLVYSSPLPDMVSHILEVFVIVIWGRYLIKQLNDCTQGHSYKLIK